MNIDGGKIFKWWNSCSHTELDDQKLFSGGMASIKSTAFKHFYFF